MRNVFFTVGHATRPIESFAGLLRLAEVRTVIDVRTMPRSRANPQFNHDVLSRSLGPFGIEYQHIPELGGIAENKRMFRSRSMRSGKTGAFTIMQTTPWAPSFGRAYRNY